MGCAPPAFSKPRVHIETREVARHEPNPGNPCVKCGEPISAMFEEAWRKYEARRKRTAHLLCPKCAGHVTGERIANKMVF